ncbi:MAG: RsmE family RNA methyltransferase [Armatimonadetes bacterium]|nr:RsmE family RNA methyltransferase [Armatimonadota bacterium]
MAALPDLHLPISISSPLDIGLSVSMDGVNLARLRFREVRGGESFTLADAAGRYFRARLISCEAGNAEATVFEAFSQPPEPEVTVTLFQAVPARERMLWIVQKAVELGAVRIVPLLTARSLNTKEELSREKIHRWLPAAVRAVRQCRRAVVPEILPPLPLPNALRLSCWQEAGAGWVLSETGEDVSIRPGDCRGSAALAVGPEGGWTEEEEDIWRMGGGRLIRLGERVLRTETAAIAGLALLAYG